MTDRKMTDKLHSLTWALTFCVGTCAASGLPLAARAQTSAAMPNAVSVSETRAQEGKEKTPAGVEADYVLGPDDVIEITVSNHVDLNKQIAIPPDGKITLSDIGDFMAAGKTRQALAREIQTEYDKTLNNAVVTIIAREVRSRRVGITGGVRAPQYYDLKHNWRLVDLITGAGGLTGKPNRYHGILVRRLQTISLHIEQAYAKPDDTNANVLLESGDLVVLDELTPLHDEVHVLGQVNRIGAYALDEHTTLFTLITAAGGINDHAALSKAYVTRDGMQIPLNLRPSLAQNKTDDFVNNFKLKPGDVLTIPDIENRYGVMGQVARPQYYAIPEKGPVNVFEALNLAGGQLPNGDLSKAGIIRNVDGTPTVIKVNLNNVLKKPEIATNYKLQADDILFIPPRGPRGVVWQDVLTPLSALSFFGLRIFH